jgi:hypothetical protein
MNETPREFRTKDHPQANGKKAQYGDVEYRLTFPLEDGTDLFVVCGKEGMRNLRNVVLAELCDDETVTGS